jgi:hypothetical protein
MSSPAQRAKALRQQRWRQRQATGQIVVTVTIPQHEVVEALIAAKRLTAVETFDRQKLARAVGEVVVEWSQQWAKGAKIP